MNISILDPFDAREKFVIDKNKDEAIGVITTYISHEIWFHTNGIDYPHEASNKMKSMFDKVDESRVM